MRFLLRRQKIISLQRERVAFKTGANAAALRAVKHPAREPRAELPLNQTVKVFLTQMPSVETSRENGKKGGRPKGSKGALAKISEYKARQLASENEMPLDVMIDNMLFWRGRAAELTNTMKAKLDDLSKFDISDPEQRGPFIEAMRQFNKTAAYMIAAREKAQSCAVDAAPYVHPKLTSIAFKQKHSKVKIQMAIAVAVQQTLDDDSSDRKQLNGHAA